MNRIDPQSIVSALRRRKPQAYAAIAGSGKYPALRGSVRFHQTPLGVLVVAEVSGLPSPGTQCSAPVFGFHIHEGTLCRGEASDPFSEVGSHYNPAHCSHPFHAGDLPPLFSANGLAFSAFLTDRFTAREIIGKTVIIHGSPDDFTTQPAGNAGEKIACGEIR